MLDNLQMHSMWDDFPEISSYEERPSGIPVERLSGTVDGIDVVVSKKQGDNKMMVFVGQDVCELVPSDMVIHTILDGVRHAKESTS